MRLPVQAQRVVHLRSLGPCSDRPNMRHLPPPLLAEEHPILPLGGKHYVHTFSKGPTGF